MNTAVVVIEPKYFVGRSNGVAVFENALLNIANEVSTLAATLSACTVPVSYTHLTLPTIYSV